MTAAVVQLEPPLADDMLTPRELALETQARLQAYRPRSDLERRLKVTNLMQLDRYLRADARARHPSNA